MTHGPGAKRTNQTSLSALRKRERGVTLIEVLVTVLVLSVALLGSAALQITGIRYSQGALVRTQASLLAYDVVERMRVNPGEATSYDTAFGDSVSSVDCIGSSVDCTTAQLATHDLGQWKQALADLLPSGEGAIETTDTTAGTEVAVCVRWASRAEQSDPPAPAPDCPADAATRESRFEYQTEIPDA